MKLMTHCPGAQHPSVHTHPPVGLRERKKSDDGPWALAQRDAVHEGEYREARGSGGERGRGAPRGSVGGC